MSERKWDKAFLKWSKGQGPKPGPHPRKSHTWNIDPDAITKQQDSEDEENNYDDETDSKKD